MSGLFFEDFEVGAEYVTPRRTVTEADVTAFAGLSGDYNPLHTDRVFCRETPFGEPIAHGLLVLAIASGLVSRLGIFDGTVIALLGVSEWRFLKPVRFGDTVHVRVTITHTRPTTHPGRGIVQRRMSIVNQGGETVQEGQVTLMCRRRPPDAAA